MPIYEYRCTDCGHVFSRLQKVGATADGVTCPECGGANSERLVSTFASTSPGSQRGASSCGAASGGFT
ncbi:MAG: zinc ribbon domain-containing protein [Acidobacteria bacterium]|jgi:putative FmdB family regulatory protein|nr:zinc ribbon domain-containing protein [Acidobacteriota bacterium]